MTVNASILGIFGSLLLAWPALHDMWQRARIYRDLRCAEKDKSPVLAALGTACAETAEVKRNTFNIPDAVANLLGALLLVAAFYLEYRKDVG